MSKQYLDKTGLAYFWQKIKAYIATHGGGTDNYNDLSNKPSINSVTLSGNKSASDLSLASASHSHTKSDISDFPSLATVATTGGYDDLFDKPSIPTKTSDLTNDSGFITGYTETDPVFSASAAHNISSTDISNWNGKSTVSLNRKTTSGTNIADITINGTTTQLYAPTSGGGGGSGTVTSVGITNGGGLSVSGSPVTSSGNITVGHSNSVPAGTIGSTSATSGETVSIPYATYDSNGHITGNGTHTHTITGFLTEETDPTVPSWAKASTKPSYTASEVGAVPIGSDGIYIDIADSATKTVPSNNTADFSWTYTIPTGYRAMAMSANVRSVGNNHGRISIFGFTQYISGRTMTLSCGSRNSASSDATGISIRARILVIKDS